MKKLIIQTFLYLNYFISFFIKKKYNLELIFIHYNKFFLLDLIISIELKNNDIYFFQTKNDFNNLRISEILNEISIGNKMIKISLFDENFNYLIEITEKKITIKNYQSQNKLNEILKTVKSIFKVKT